MPSIKNIDKFVQLLNSLGDEPAVLEKRGQTIEPAGIPDKNPVNSNPFLVNIEDEKERDEDETDIDLPDFSSDLDSFDDDLFNDEDLDIDNHGMPDLEEDESFNLDDISFDSDDIEEINDIDDIPAEEDLGEELSNFDNFDDEVDEVDDLEEFDEFSLDTAEDALDDDSEIKDIDIDDIGFDDEPEEEDTGFSLNFDDLSIEDEVLEDDFGSLDDDDSDEFSLGDFGDSFNFDKEASTTSLKLDELTASSEVEPEVEELKFTDTEFEKIQATLRDLPLNLKLVIEEEIAENGLFGTKLEGLTDLLIRNAPLKEIVKYVNKILGHKIKISPSFKKLTALDFEKQKEKFLYILVNSVFPKIKWIVPISVACALLFLAGYFWGYKIFKSESIYKLGHELILVDKYEEAYDKFIEAFETHRKGKWYKIYADTYYQRKAFPYAEKIYIQTLNENSKDKEAILSYVNMVGFDEAEYAKATNFLMEYITKGYTDYIFLTTLGDLYMKWAEVDSTHYEDARLWYAETMKEYGPKPEILFKYLNYFIKTDNLQEVKNYRRMFEISTDVEVDGDTFARMAGYLMDKGIVENVRDTLFRGIADDPRNPNLHFQLARYFNSIGNDREVEKAARNAIFYYEYGGSLSEEELTSLIETKRILGDIYAHDERYLVSEKNYQEAVSLYENLRDRSFVEKNEKFGKIYAGYGDIFYYAGNSLNTAYNLYEKAEENMYTTNELSYKKGFIKYQDNDLKDALLEFHKSENVRLKEEAIWFAKANTLSLRGSYDAALTYYNIHLKYLQHLEDEEETLYPSENEYHLAIIENYIRLYNNIAVTLYKLHGEKELPQVGMYLTQSTEKFDYLTRDPDLLIRSGLKDLAYYNTKAILYPDKEMELLLYKTISKDFKDLNLGLVTALK